jgi:hypothetical protein
MKANARTRAQSHSFRGRDVRREVAWVISFTEISQRRRRLEVGSPVELDCYYAIRFPRPNIPMVSGRRDRNLSG